MQLQKTLMRITNEQLENAIEAFKKQKFGEKFIWRKHQKETIIDILKFYTENPTGVYILEAPTGSGKSIIAMTVGGVLSRLGKNGYILASDLSLQSQYENDFKSYKTGWGSVKGIDNYNCLVNGEKTSLGVCKVKNLSMKETGKLPCFADCPYFSARNHAIKSEVALLNYSYWLIMQNYVKPRMVGAPFGTRDFTICDEAHKVTALIQNHFSPQLSLKTIEMLTNLRQFLAREFQLSVNSEIHTVAYLIKEIFNTQSELDTYEHLKKLEKNLLQFVKSGSGAKEYLRKKYNDKPIPKTFTRGLNLVDRVKDLHCKVEDFCDIIDKTSPFHVVKSYNGDNVVLNCVEENYMMQKYFHQNTNFVLMMSATLGDEKSFIDNINAGDRVTKFRKLDNIFDFEKSPIYVWKNIRMSWKEKAANLPKVVDMTEKILSKHTNEKGIIHTSSYDITNGIYESLSEESRERVLIYSDSKNKRELLEYFEKSSDKVLMGPSLLEGLDFYDDRSRFQIFAKVPYPSLADKFIKRKMEIKPLWYKWQTVVSIEQGVGRSIRNPEDWAVTYFLDGCLMDLVKWNGDGFTTDFINRLRIIK